MNAIESVRRDLDDRGSMMGRMKLALLLGVLIAAIAGGCARYVFPNDRERHESFGALSTATVDGEPLNRFVFRRTAILIGSDSGQHATLGEAVAVDSRGYFLTAAHCLEAGHLRLMYLDGDSKLKIVVPRVVAVRSDKSREDFAIVHINAVLPCVFAWSEERALASGQPAVAAGLGSDSAESDAVIVSRSVCMAGRITSTERSSGIATRIVHDVPLRPGDSGGPLVTVDGKLLGLNTGVRVPWTGRAVRLAIRPDPRWIRQEIDKDTAGRRTAQKQRHG